LESPLTRSTVLPDLKFFQSLIVEAIPLAPPDQHKADHSLPNDKDISHYSAIPNRDTLQSFLV
jgi:hypothetical protein